MKKNSSQTPHATEEGFLWGAATSSHQVEGNTHNDWSVWEKEHANQLAKNATSPEFVQATDPQNYISGEACDHYHRFENDFDIAQQLGHNAHRFSIEWSRVEPEKGKFDKEAIDHYRQVVQALKKRNITPCITLWHFTTPLWIAHKGGWAWRKTPRYFERFASTMAQALGNDVTLWMTLNEPMIYTGNAFIRGSWTPQKKNPLTYIKVVHRCIEAHRRTYRAIKEVLPSAKVGIVKNAIYFEAGNERWYNAVLTKIVDWWWNDYVLNRIKKENDCIGVNYYFHSRVDKGCNKNKNKQTNDMGWEIYPEGIYHVLVGYKKYHTPLYITENGIPDAADTKRAQFIKDHVTQMEKAKNEGVDVRGYFYWSLLDNFEWDKGFWPRFGLVEVDYNTQKRTIRDSAWEYKKIIEKGI
jgi:beta-glucosidase